MLSSAASGQVGIGMDHQRVQPQTGPSLGWVWQNGLDQGMTGRFESPPGFPWLALVRARQLQLETTSAAGGFEHTQFPLGLSPGGQGECLLSFLIESLCRSRPGSLNFSSMVAKQTSWEIQGSLWARRNSGAWALCVKEKKTACCKHAGGESIP